MSSADTLRPSGVHASARGLHRRGWQAQAKRAMLVGAVGVRTPRPQEARLVPAAVPACEAACQGQRRIWNTPVCRWHQQQSAQHGKLIAGPLHASVCNYCCQFQHSSSFDSVMLECDICAVQYEALGMVSHYKVYEESFTGY